MVVHSFVSVGSKRHPEKPFDSMAGFFDHLKTTLNLDNNNLKIVNRTFLDYTTSSFIAEGCFERTVGA